MEKPEPSSSNIPVTGAAVPDVSPVFTGIDKDGIEEAETIKEGTMETASEAQVTKPSCLPIVYQHQQSSDVEATLSVEISKAETSTPSGQPETAMGETSTPTTDSETTTKANKRAMAL